ncbi:DUF4421 family protein [Flavobacterium sp. MC2016-06]|uniref:DUF4421 family protein n=1 Tax=Flavobacterium sp. MC2016-06 TaxID=2676308 RepID=UPI0012BA6161|nr:DUF4421 family protein [Flavobacterium sp. MC2016-06]MBU3857925.1 DUF4421 domain-containing protein [Flavobacterium sp. MC2016-06]
MRIAVKINSTIYPSDFFKSFFCLPFIFFVFHLGSAQSKSKKDTVNFIYYPDKIMVKANVSTQTDTYFYKAKESENLKIVPNNDYKLFFTVDYKFIGFSYGFFPKFFGGNNDNDLKGKSSFSDYNFRLFLGHWLQNFQYSKVRGYYVENTDDFTPGWVKGKDPYYQFPNLKNVTYGMSTSYVFNPKFSLRSISSFTEWQKKSAGSFIPTLWYDYNRFSFDQGGNNSKEDNFNIRLGLSYYYNFIIRDKFYIAPNLTPSLGVRFSKDKSGDSEVHTVEKETYFTKFLEGGIKMGYNSNNILFGAGFNFNVSWYNEDSKSSTENNKIYGLLYFGYRFDAPKFIAKPIEKVEEKMKL